jgi:hypothetical protein
MNPSATPSSGGDPSAVPEQSSERRFDPPPPEPGGTPAPSPGDLTTKPSSPGEPDTDRPTAVPGAYDADEADEAERERGAAVKPGN